MSTEVHQQATGAAAPVESIITDTNIVVESTESAAPAPNAFEVAETTAPAPNGDSKTAAANGEKKNGSVKKEPETPKDPKTETAGWLNQQNKNKKAVHKANSFLLQWAVNEAYFAEEEDKKPELPKSGFVTKKEFVEQLKDGVILARLANKLKPGSIDGGVVKEGEEAKSAENQKINVNGFIAFAKQYLPEEQVFTYEELEKGKESFNKVFVTLFQLMLKADEQFQRPTIDFEQFFKELGEIVPKSFIQKIKDNFNNISQFVSSLARRPFTRSNSNLGTEPTPQNGTETNGVNGTTAITTATTTEANLTHEGNGVSNGTTDILLNGGKIENKEEAPAVTAN